MSDAAIDKKIRKGLPPRNDHSALQTLNDIVIPAGTFLRPIGDDEFAAKFSFAGAAGIVTVTAKPGAPIPPGSFKRVVTS